MSLSLLLQIKCDAMLLATKTERAETGDKRQEAGGGITYDSYLTASSGEKRRFFIA
jgi:hypothetical protein